jgi:quinol-cytochrome oxidoreductase complex cytochrome b subunit
MYKYDAWITAMLIMISIVLKISSVVALYFTYEPTNAAYRTTETIEISARISCKPTSIDGDCDRQ